MSRLSEINRSAYNYYESVLPQFNEICEPLYNLGIKEFGYFRLYGDGRYLYLINNKNYVMNYIDKIKDQGSNFDNVIINEISLNKDLHFSVDRDATRFDEDKDPILHLASDFELLNLHGICKLRQKNYIEFYNFTFPEEVTNPAEAFLNKRMLLERFMTYFDQRASDITSSVDKNTLAALEKQFNISQISQEEALTKKIEDFLQRTSISQHIGCEDVRITKREMDCLRYLALCKSIKEVARALDLSPRTVETYVNNIKVKTGLSNRSALMEHFFQVTPK